MNSRILCIVCLLFFSCNKEKIIDAVNKIEKESDNKNSSVIDTAKFNKDMTEYLEISKEIDSLWDDLAGGRVKMSERKNT